MLQLTVIIHTHIYACTGTRIHTHAHSRILATRTSLIISFGSLHKLVELRLCDVLAVVISQQEVYLENIEKQVPQRRNLRMQRGLVFNCLW